MSSRLRGMVPLVPVADMAASLGFYRDALGFRLISGAASSRFAMVGRGGARIGLQAGFGADVVAVTGTHLAASVLVDDLDGYWAEIAPGLAGLPPGRVRRPFRQDYGVREFHVKDPDGFLMFFSEAADMETEV